MGPQDLAADPTQLGLVEPDRVAADEGAELGRSALGRLGRGVREDPADPERPLDGGDLRGVDPRRGDPVDEVAEGAQRDRLLTERGQDPLDVGRVGGGGADDEDAAGLEAAPLGVEQVCRPVQRDDRLARARTAGDLGDPPGGCPDRLVLVALDRRDDVAHLPAAAAREGGDEGAVPDDDEVVGCLRDHEVVLDADDLGAAAAQHPAADDTHRVDRRRPVERGGGRGSPVDDERLVVVVAHPEPADVADLALGARPVGLEVEAAEDEPFVLLVDARAAAGRGVDERVALEEAGHLLVAHVAHAVGPAAGEAVGLDMGRALGGLRQLGVDTVDVGLLEGDLAGRLCGGVRHAGTGSGHAVVLLAGRGRLPRRSGRRPASTEVAAGRAVEHISLSVPGGS